MSFKHLSWIFFWVFWVVLPRTGQKIPENIHTHPKLALHLLTHSSLYNFWDLLKGTSPKWKFCIPFRSILQQVQTLSFYGLCFSVAGLQRVTGRATLSLPLSRTQEQGWNSCCKFLYTAITHKEQILWSRPPWALPCATPCATFLDRKE